MFWGQLGRKAQRSMPVLAKVGTRMPFEIDEEKLAKFKAGKKAEMVKRNYYTDPARLAEIDAAVKEFEFKSFNKFMDAASEWFIGALNEKKAKRGGKK